MIKTNQITPTQIEIRHNGQQVGQFRKMTPGVWVFLPNSNVAYTPTMLRDITDRLSQLGIAGAQS